MKLRKKPRKKLKKKNKSGRRRRRRRRSTRPKKEICLRLFMNDSFSLWPIRHLFNNVALDFRVFESNFEGHTLRSGALKVELRVTGS
jgi:hypothetical protein